jgi:AcrR family transcriptional regulator
MTGVASVLSRRDQVRAATVREIRQAARRIVLERGPRAASLRAVAAEMGMTAPGLYRYFASRHELLEHVAAEILTDLAGDIHAAAGGAGAPGEADPAGRLAAACREFRRWSLGHPAAFGMLFGAPLPGWDARQDEVAAGSRQKFAAAFLGPFVELWRADRFAVPADDQIDPGLRRQLERYRGHAGAGLPLGAVLVFLRCWVRLYGSVATEVCGRPGCALDDAGPVCQLVAGNRAVP